MKVGLPDASRRARVIRQKAADRGSQGTCHDHRAQVPVKLASRLQHGKTPKELHDLHIGKTRHLWSGQAIRGPKARHLFQKINNAGCESPLVATKELLRVFVLLLNFLSTGFGQLKAHLCCSQLIRVFILKLKAGIGFSTGGVGIGVGSGKLGVLSFVSLLEFQFLSLESVTPDL
jgi:hypothetical protein